MLLHSTDKLPFGKYRNINLGLVYLLSPGYINWMLETHMVNYCIGDIEFLQSLKVINRFGNQGYVAHIADVDTEEFRSLWASRIEFEDVKFSGYEYFTFSQMALENNRRKLDHCLGIKKREITPEEDRDIFIFYPGTFKRSEKTSFTPVEASINIKGRTVLTFELDNSFGNIDFLPFRTNLRVSSFFWPDWGITSKEMERHLSSNKPFRGKILNGQLILEKTDR